MEKYNVCGMCVCARMFGYCNGVLVLYTKG